MSQVKSEFSGTGNLSFGYFGGGETPSRVSTVDRIDYGNDTVTASPRGNLNHSKTYAMSAGNNDFGYQIGGGIAGPATNIISRPALIILMIATAAAKGPLSSSAWGGSATGNSSFGYVDYYGGTSDRIDYSNDTATALVRGQIFNSGFYRYWTEQQVVKKDGHPDTSNISPVADNFGYFGAGYGSSLLVAVDRIDYSSDTTAAAPKGPLTLGRSDLGATSNASFGYFAGGHSPKRSTVDRIDYGNDTATAVAKGPLSIAIGYHGAAGNSSFGYFAGGGSPKINSKPY